MRPACNHDPLGCAICLCLACAASGSNAGHPAAASSGGVVGSGATGRADDQATSGGVSAGAGDASWAQQQMVHSPPAAHLQAGWQWAS